MTNTLSTAELAIYATLAVPVAYLAIKHLAAGLLGWLYLFAFCTIRIVGGALSMSSDSPSAAIISNIGLSPLLLATSGILHEARTYRLFLNAKLEWTLVVLFHIVVASGIGLVGAGASALQSTHATSSDRLLVDVGIGLLTVSWLILCIWTAISFLPSQHSKSAIAHSHGTKILFSAVVALPLIGIRVFYSLVALTTRAADLNPVTGSMAIRVVLGLLPELLATLVFIVVGIWTRSVAKLHQSAGHESST